VCFVSVFASVCRVRSELCVFYVMCVVLCRVCCVCVVSIVCAVQIEAFLCCMLGMDVYHVLFSLFY